MSEEYAIRSGLRRCGYIAKRFQWGGFRVIHAQTGAVVAGKRYDLTLDDLALLLRQAKASHRALSIGGP